MQILYSSMSINLYLVIFLLHFGDSKFFGRQKSRLPFFVYNSASLCAYERKEDKGHRWEPSFILFFLLFLSPSLTISRESAAKKNTCAGERNRGRKEEIDAILSSFSACHSSDYILSVLRSKSGLDESSLSRFCPKAVPFHAISLYLPLDSLNERTLATCAFTRSGNNTRDTFIFFTVIAHYIATSDNIILP